MQNSRKVPALITSHTAQLGCIKPRWCRANPGWLGSVGSLHPHLTAGPRRFWSICSLPLEKQKEAFENEISAVSDRDGEEGVEMYRLQRRAQTAAAPPAAAEPESSIGSFRPRPMQPFFTQFNLTAVAAGWTGGKKRPQTVLCKQPPTASSHTAEDAFVKRNRRNGVKPSFPYSYGANPKLFFLFLVCLLLNMPACLPNL